MCASIFSHVKWGHDNTLLWDSYGIGQAYTSCVKLTGRWLTRTCPVLTRVVVPSWSLSAGKSCPVKYFLQV